ncbi:hypothetical protein SESBI_13178 [Sesbania bispinosa]|nr:hypothetical protein SESBI_13178 [Sesbania bispinosa]
MATVYDNIRLWEMCPIELLGLSFAIEMVMIDGKGDKFQATIGSLGFRSFCSRVGFIW